MPFGTVAAGTKMAGLLNLTGSGLTIYTAFRQRLYPVTLADLQSSLSAQVAAPHVSLQVPLTTSKQCCGSRPSMPITALVINEFTAGFCDRHATLSMCPSRLPATVFAVVPQGVTNDNEWETDRKKYHKACQNVAYQSRSEPSSRGQADPMG